MNKLTQHITGFYLVLFLIMTAVGAEGGTKTFPAGSYIIPQDLCWQPTKYYPDSPRPLTVEICGNGYDDDGDGTIDEANTALLPYNCYDLTGCDTNRNDQGIFQSTGLIYEILTAGYPVYWIINPNKTDQLGVDASISKSGTTAAVTILYSPKTDSGTKTTVEYRGGPFIIDANDYDSGMQTLFDKYKGSTGTNGVKIHKSNYDFSAEVDKVLSGKPPDVAVLGEGSTQVLTDYLFASGLANQQAVVFKYLTTPDIIAGGLSDYQLLWAPHWEIDAEVPVVADRTKVLGKIRSFLEAGNAGFFECASIESLERAYDVSKNTTAPSQYYTGQGLLLDKTYNDTKGRLQTNGGTQDYNKIKLEHFTDVMMQCGGWRYNTTGGHVHNLRASEIPNPDYTYNSTVDRFIHDDETRTDLGYSGKGYDYFIGGRINGSSTQGYVAYLAGHKYVKCSNATTSTPSTRFLEFDFTADTALAPTTTVYVEAVYSGCTQGSTCPKASFNLTSQTGTYSTDGTLFVDLDSAEYVADADPATKYTLKNVIIGNKNTTTDKTLTGVNVTFSGNPTTTLLTQITDVTLTPSTVLCTPNSPTPASCPSIAKKTYDFNFDTALASPTTVQVEAVYSGCTAGSTCPKGTYNTATGAYTSGSDGTINIDMSAVTYESPIGAGVCPGPFSGSGSNGGSGATCLANNTFTAIAGNSYTISTCDSYTGDSYLVVSGSCSCSNDDTGGACGLGSTCSCTAASTGVANICASTYSTSSATWSYAITGTCALGKLKGVKISNLSGANKTIDRFVTTFSGNGNAQLTTAQDVTTTATTVCTSNETSSANCPKATATAVPKVNTFAFKNNITTGTIYIEVFHAGCTQGSTCSKASFDVATNVGTSSSTDGKVKIDLTTANLNHSFKQLENVILTNLTGSAITVTKFWVQAPNDSGGSASKLKSIKAGSTTLYSNSGLTLSLTTPGTQVSLSTTESLTLSTQTLNVTLAGAPSPLNVTLAKSLTQCDVDWGSANACGMKYVLNTLVGLQFQVIPHEYNKAGAIQQDNILYKGSFEYPGYKGHLYSIDVKQNPAYTNWDAGKKTIMPSAGAGNPASPTKTNATRYIFTNKPGTTTKIGFDVANVGSAQTDTTKLWYYLDPAATQTLNGVKALINSVRGRKNASDASVNGDGEVSKRLGGIEHSSSAIMTKSELAGAANRDRVVFVGAHDGMLHAFYAGTWDSALNSGAGGYTVGTGKEIWAYIPPTLLGSLQNETFTDCNPSEVLVGCVVDLTATPPETCECPIFSVAVTVDGSPALGDFFVDHDNDPSTPKQWRTIVVVTAKVMTPGASSVSVNQGIIFALDVTDPYTPTVLWERTYNAAVDTSVSPGNAIKRNYYPSSTFTTAYKTGENTSFDPNMGDAKGVAIGRVQVGTTLDTYVFLTSRWVRQVDVSTTATPHNIWGLTVYALDFYSGDIRWETKIAYTGDAEGVNEPPATPALLDYGNNGTYDYVVLGDMQGRLWVLKSIDGKTINSSGDPAYTVGNGAKEPIGASVAIYNNSIVFGTGGRDSLQDESTTQYHLYAIEINSKGEVTNLWTPPYASNAGEKIWSSPVIDDSGAVYVGTAKGYTDVGRPDMMAASSGRLLVLELSTGKLKKDSSNNDMKVDLGGAVVGDIAIENNHVTIQLFDGTSVQIGAASDASFDSTATQTNPVKVLWWRKL